MTRIWQILNKMGTAASLIGLLVVLLAGALGAMEGHQDPGWRLFYCLALFVMAVLSLCLMVHLCWQRLLSGDAGLPKAAQPTTKKNKDTMRYVVAGVVVLVFSLVIGVCCVGMWWALTASQVWTPPFFRVEAPEQAMRPLQDYMHVATSEGMKEGAK